MKKYLMVFAILFSYTSYAQKIDFPVDSVSKKITYQEVVQVPGVTKDDLYIRAREWFAHSFKSAQDVIQMDDKQAGKIIGKGTTRGTSGNILLLNQFTMYYTVSLTVKDGRYRYEITDFEKLDDPSKYVAYNQRMAIDSFQSPIMINKKGEYKDFVKGYMLTAHSTATSFISTLKAALSQPATGVKTKDDF